MLGLFGEDPNKVSHDEVLSSVIFWCDWIIKYLQSFVKAVSNRLIITNRSLMLSPFGLSGGFVIFVHASCQKGGCNGL